MSERKFVTPSITETAFNCPHCGALTTQRWFDIHAEPVDRDQRTPTRLIGEEVDEKKLAAIEDNEAREKIRKWFESMSRGLPFLYRREDSTYVYWDVNNMSVAQCFNCSRPSIWIGNNLAWPVIGEAPVANPDLPEEIRLDYDEAGLILNLSPRGAAALLRLAIQKLCKHLGGNGKNIDDDIAELVKTGLDVRVQRALDIVRVIGNEAVHPGQIDLRDDRATAEKLFGLVNLIADKMISQPNAVDALYNDLPKSKREAIEQRDKARTAPR